MTIDQAVKLAKKIISNHHELKDWRVSLNRSKGNFGTCYYTYKEIQLSIFLIPVITDEAILDTINHEIAHALTPGHHHDNIWKQKFIELGGSGRSTGNCEHYKDGADGRQAYKESVAKYTLTCPVCDAKIYINRKPAKKYACARHGRVYNPKYNFIVVQNY